MRACGGLWGPAVALGTPRCLGDWEPSLATCGAPLHPSPNREEDRRCDKGPPTGRMVSAGRRRTAWLGLPGPGPLRAAPPRCPRGGGAGLEAWAARPGGKDAGVLGGERGPQGPAPLPSGPVGRKRPPCGASAGSRRPGLLTPGAHFQSGGHLPREEAVQGRGFSEWLPLGLWRPAQGPRRAAAQ